MSSARPLRVSEIFESVQGEGPSAGEPSVFLRLAVCNLRCSWCDTKYTWDWAAFRYEDEVHAMSVDEVRERIVRSGLGRLVVTGGEPLLQTRELGALFVELPAHLYIEVETNGTLLSGAELAARVDQWNVSPKLGNSGEPLERRLKADVLASFRDTGRAFLKLVVEGETDALEVDALIRQINWPHDRVLLMPQASSRAELLEKGPHIEALAERLRFRTSPRLHVLRWDGKRGT
jgi:7-carboxy-7-deazaguanine synthase